MIETLGKNKYRFIVNIGSGATRRRVTKTITFDGGKKALKKLYDEFEESALAQKPLSDITIEELLDSHIAFVETIGRKQTTIRGYRKCVQRLDCRFKNIKAKDCTTYQIEKEITRMSKYGLSAKTIKNSIGLISAAYEHAIHTKQLEDNPCKYATLPKGTKREVKILFRDDIQLFLNGIADAPLDDKVAYELALFMGLRRSEILGLKESDIDLNNGILFIHNTRHQVDGIFVDQDTKTVRSTRTLAIPELVLFDIARLLDSRKDFKYEKVDYLIQDGFGNAPHPDTLSSRLKRLEKEKGLPLVSMHGLRHTYASLLNASGIDIARISAELGHSNLSTTANIYTHIFEQASQSSRGIASAINQITELSTEPKKLSTK